MDIYERMGDTVEGTVNFHNFMRKATLVLYIVGMNCYNVETKTGHVSADIATGRSQPTVLESALIDLVKK